MNHFGQSEILNLARNFMECRILLSGAELNLFTLLSKNFLSIPEILTRIKADQKGITLLLDALSAMGLLDKQGDSYFCPPSNAVFLSSESPVSILPWILHMANVWKRWNSLTEIVRGTRPPDDWITSSQTTTGIRAFIGAMHVLAAPMAPRIVAAVRPQGSRALLDVGGATGTYTIAFLRAVPGMKATLFDKPEVIDIARPFIKSEGFSDRVRLVPGDFYKDEFPGGHDLGFISAIIHQNSPEQNLDLYRKTYRSLDSGGRIIVRDHVMDPDRTRPVSGALFAINMLVSTPGGTTYTFEEIRDGLSRAGFTDIRLLQTGNLMDGLVEGVKP